MFLAENVFAFEFCTVRPDFNAISVLLVFFPLASVLGSI
jgi:hypothetical protein